MAYEEANNVYQMVLGNPLPHLKDPTIENIFLLFLCRYAKVHYIHERWALYAAADALARDMAYHFYRPYDSTDILHKIIQLRARFVDFRAFINGTKVHFEEWKNQVTVDEDYYTQWGENEEPESDRHFRENGLYNYRAYKFIFVICKASLLWYEPERNYYSELPFRPSDPVDEGFEDPEDNWVLDEEIDNYGVEENVEEPVEVVDDNSWMDD